MVLRELSIYEEEDDFLTWCHQNESDASSRETHNFYRGLDLTYQEIKRILGTIDPIFSNRSIVSIVSNRGRSFDRTRSFDRSIVRFEYLEFNKKNTRCLIL